MGLLDGLSGILNNLNNDQSQQGISLLAAGGQMPGNVGMGQRLQMFVQAQMARKREEEERKAKAEDRAQRNQYVGAQVDEMRAQALQRQAQAQKMTALMSEIQKWTNPQNEVHDANEAVRSQTGGNLAPTVRNAELQSQSVEARRKSNPLFGIPAQAIQADLAFNDGKGISDMMFKRGTPNIDFVNGVAVDKNNTSPGFSVPTLSQNGQASQIVADPTAPGGYRVIAPEGAMDTFAAYQRQGEQAKAEFDPVKVWNPQSRREEYMPRAALVQGQATSQAPEVPRVATTGQRAQQPGAQRTDGMHVAPEAQQARDAERLSILRDELTRETNPENRAALEREIARTTGGAPARYAAGPSAEENAQVHYDAEVSKDFAARRKTLYDSAELAAPRIADYQRLDQLLKQHDGGLLSPTGLQIAKTMNSLGLQVDPNLGNKEAAVALTNRMALDLRNPAGGAGMPGALSDTDRRFLSEMIPSLATSAKGRGLMVQAGIAMEKRKQEVAQFARNFERKHGRLDAGFYDQLQAWSNANPLFPRQQQERSSGRNTTGSW